MDILYCNCKKVKIDSFSIFAFKFIDNNCDVVPYRVRTRRSGDWSLRSAVFSAPWSRARGPWKMPRMNWANARRCLLATTPWVTLSCGLDLALNPCCWCLHALEHLRLACLIDANTCMRIFMRWLIVHFTGFPAMAREQSRPLQAKGRLTIVSHERCHSSDSDGHLRWPWRHWLYCRGLGCAEHVSTSLCVRLYQQYLHERWCFALFFSESACCLQNFWNEVRLVCSQSNIVEFSRDIRLLAALQEDQSDGDKLLDAARKLASAFSDLLNAAQPGSKEVDIVAWQYVEN